MARGAGNARRDSEPRRAPRLPIAAAVPAVAALGLLLLAGPAFAGASIARPFGEAHRDSLGPDGLPVPEVAAQLSANSTVVPLACGGAAALVGAAGSAPLIVIGVAFAAAGVVLGPAAGYRYGDVPGHGMRGVVVRTVLVAGAPFVAAGVANSSGLDDEQRRARNFYCALGGLGLATIVAVWDVGHVEESVRRHNEAVKRAGGVSLGPAVAPFSGAPGLAVRVALGPGGE